jgi:hypothetical protein
MAPGVANEARFGDGRFGRKQDRQPSASANVTRGGDERESWRGMVTFGACAHGSA